MGGLHFESAADMPPGLRKIYTAQQVAGQIVAASVQAVPVAGREAKYHNVKVVVDGHRFDSKKEARRYEALMDALREGLIYDLRLQHNFTLIEGYTTPEGERIQPEIYKADFTYRVNWPCYAVPTSVSMADLDYWRTAAVQHGNGVMIIEDVKSRGTRTQVYINKRKLMAEKGYTIREV